MLFNAASRRLILLYDFGALGLATHCRSAAGSILDCGSLRPYCLSANSPLMLRYRAQPAAPSTRGELDVKRNPFRSKNNFKQPHSGALLDVLLNHLYHVTFGGGEAVKVRNHAAMFGIVFCGQLDRVLFGDRCAA
jgi:hypothetical protein